MIKAIRAEWDAVIERDLHPKMVEFGFSRQGKGWRKAGSSTDRIGMIDFGRTCLKNHLRVACYVHVWARHRRKVDFGTASSTLKSDIDPKVWMLSDLAEVHHAVAELEDYIFKHGVPSINRLLADSQNDGVGVTVIHIDDLDHPDTR